MGWFGRPRSRKVPAGQIVQVKDRELGVIDLGGVISHDVRALIDRNLLTHGEPFRSGGVLGTSCLPILGAGSATASSLFAGNVFLATANPATLMAMKGGVGSAVVAGGQIVGQAPFIAASTAILPVVLPVMFFMTVSSMMMSVRFDRVQSSLDKLAGMIREALKREVAEDYGEVLSAIARLQDISAEFDESRRFTDEMMIRLALVERDLGSVHQKYDVLIGGSLSGTGEATDVELAPVDQHLYALSGVASVYVDRQRVRLALQDNPDDLARSVGALNAKVRRTKEGFRKLLEENPLVEYQNELRSALDDMGWWDRNVLERGRRQSLEQADRRTDKIRADQLTTVLLALQSWSDSMADADDQGLQHSVVYYRGDGGKGELKAYYTADLGLHAT